MKKTLITFMIPALLAGTFAAFAPITATETDAAVSNWNWQKAASIIPTTTTDFAGQDFKTSVINLKATGANYVSLIVPYYQQTLSSSDIYAGGNTPTDAALIDAINFVHSQGMNVMLKPHVELPTATWRAKINPTNRDAWFREYGDMLNHLADISKQTGVEEICIGTELISVSTYTSNANNTQRWITMIQDVKSRYSGLLTYSANWGNDPFSDELLHIGFWQYLDFIGLSGYFPLAANISNPTVNDYMASWQMWDNDRIKDLAAKYNKQIVFTEIGYRSVAGAHTQPFNYALSGAVSEQEQANLYQAFFQYWDTKSYVTGIHIWDWNINPNIGGPNNDYFTPHNKKAEQIITEWFKKGTTPPTVPVPATWSATATGTINPAGTQTSFSVTVKSPSDISSALVDFEIYNQSGTLVSQQVVSNQPFTAGQTKTLSLNWTPQLAGAYTLKVGVFANDWSSLYYWNNAVTTFTVPTAPVVPPVIPPVVTPPTTPTTTPPTIPTTGPAVTSFTLYNASTNNPIKDFISGTVITTATTPSLSVRANVSGATTQFKSIVFKIDNVVVHSENGAPYTINGDTNGDYLPWKLPAKGNHTLTATLYSKMNGEGTIVGKPLSVTFTVK